ncbi:hypothetical protein OG21DRAFT_1520507 [Imleria badia]|nr:hypothetical protein OG21DRAFT_1520507 [Imleria badia]
MTQNSDIPDVPRQAAHYAYAPYELAHSINFAAGVDQKKSLRDGSDEAVSVNRTVMRLIMTVTSTVDRHSVPIPYMFDTSSAPPWADEHLPNSGCGANSQASACDSESRNAGEQNLNLYADGPTFGLPGFRIKCHDPYASGFKSTSSPEWSAQGPSGTSPTMLGYKPRHDGSRWCGWPSEALDRIEEGCMRSFSLLLVTTHYYRSRNVLGLEYTRVFYVRNDPNSVLQT